MFNRKYILPILSLSLLTLSACEPVAQDTGSSSTVVINGISQDGFVSGGVIWHDINNDNELDNGEPFAVTDDEGYFSRARDKTDNGIDDGVDYCGSNATTDQQRHCLQVNAASDVSTDIIIRLESGIDIITGEPFIGSISLKGTIDENGSIDSVVATPITAMLTHMSAAEATDFASREGVTVSFLKSDFLDFVFKGTNAEPNQVKFIKAALQVHKSVELANTLLLARYKIIGEAGVPSDASDFVYKAITKAFIATPDTTLSTFMETGGLTITTLTTIFKNAESELINAVKSAGKIQGTDTGFPTGTVNSALWEGLAGRVLDTTGDIATAMDATVDGATAIDKDQMFARAKAIEIVKETIRQEIKTTISDIFGDDGIGTPTSQLDSITAQNNARALVSSENIKLIKDRSDTFDIAAATIQLKTESVITTIFSDNTRPEEAKLFNNSGLSVSGKEITLLTGDNADNDKLLTDVFSPPNGKFIIYFNPPANDATPNDKSDDKQGTLVVCNKFNNGKATQSTSESLGLFTDGTWVKINNYTVQLNIPKTIILKSTGLKFRTSGNREFTADINNSIEEFRSDPDLADTTTAIPTDNATCQTELNKNIITTTEFSLAG